jgi:hypothetical protein
MDCDLARAAEALHGLAEEHRTPDVEGWLASYRAFVIQYGNEGDLTRFEEYTELCRRAQQLLPSLLG